MLDESFGPLARRRAKEAQPARPLLVVKAHDAAARPVVAWASAGAIAASVVARLPLPAPAVRPESGPTIAGAVAMTSAAISLGVAAFVAWRRGRMGRGIA